MTLDEITEAATLLQLTPLGGFHEDGATTILLGPKEPGFWGYVTAQTEFNGPDPLDNWSRALIEGLAKTLGAVPLFPFGGPPQHPFISWALRSGEAWQSPVGLIVHKDAGLLVSYRGALRFDGHVELPSVSQNPCDSCDDRPCLSACPVAALGPDGYDVANCKAHVRSDPVCRSGCRVRLACPVSASYGRDAAQTAFHMEAFL